jgi:hypothetical protein
MNYEAIYYNLILKICFTSHRNKNTFIKEE